MNKEKFADINPDDEAVRQYSLPETSIKSGNRIVITDLSGEHYRHLDLTIEPGSNTVIIGDNVAARQELIHVLARADDNSDSAHINISKNAQIEFVTPAITDVDDPSLSLKDFFLAARGIQGVEQKLAELWEKSASDPKALEEAGHLQEKFEKEGGWHANSEIEALIRGLRIASNIHDKIGLNTPVGDMSSGQISKAIIGKALFSRAGIIIMDDPSVHLDVQSKAWLAEYLASSPQATIMATSDMEFATSVGDRVVEILDSKLALNIGLGVEGFNVERKKILEFWKEEAKRKKKEIKDLEIHIRDFLAPAAKRTDNMAQVLRANKTKLARMKEEFDEMPGKILIESGKHRTSQRTFKEAKRSGEVVGKIKRLSIMYNRDEYSLESTVIKINELDIFRGDRLAFIGKNGSGKSTLLRALAGDHEAMVIDGNLKLGASVDLGFYSPYTELPDKSRELRLQLGDHARDAMGILEYWGFGRTLDYDTKPSDLIYRDELARAQFAYLMALKPNLLILDEPTSYLTPTYQDRLVEALKGYDGTLLVASHDPQFLSTISLKGRVLMPSGKRENF